jgi:hypothetical protein
MTFGLALRDDPERSARAFRGAALGFIIRATEGLEPKRLGRGQRRAQ